MSWRVNILGVDIRGVIVQGVCVLEPVIAVPWIALPLEGDKIRPFPGKRIGNPQRPDIVGAKKTALISSFLYYRDTGIPSP